ncbi:unnamed protein product [Ectocarpus sp. CCAP 1310/34]|nr:unnamed protein product [Ectocarpus sp. CCAP 1310/34]
MQQEERQDGAGCPRGRGHECKRHLREKHESTLHVAAAWGAEEPCMALMVAAADPNPRDQVGFSPLHIAAKAGYGRVDAYTRILLGQGAQAHAETVFQDIPLHLATSQGHALGISELVLGGADKDVDDGNGSEVNGSDYQGHTALHNATVIEGPGPGQDDQATGDRCYTPLHVAVDRRIASIGTTRAVLERGANVNARNDNDLTPLHVACSWSSLAVVELLLLWGADEKLTGDNRVSPADIIGVSLLDGSNSQEIQADHQRIRQMLARAPADRSWRRRGWLVLSRAYPTRMQIAKRKSHHDHQQHWWLRQGGEGQPRRFRSG